MKHAIETTESHSHYYNQPGL